MFMMRSQGDLKGIGTRRCKRKWTNMKACMDWKPQRSGSEIGPDPMHGPWSEARSMLMMRSQGYLSSLGHMYRNINMKTSEGLYALGARVIQGVCMP